MATKSEILSDPNSCLNKAADDEPLFILRAQDVLAPIAVQYWAKLVTQSCQPNLDVVEKVSDACLVATSMQTYRQRKLPD